MDNFTFRKITKYNKIQDNSYSMSRFFMFLTIFSVTLKVCDFFWQTGIRENCITHKTFDGSDTIFDDDPRTCTQLPSGDLVTHRLEVKSHCVRSREVCGTFLFISI